MARVIFRLTKSHTAVVKILAIIFLPGTILHELAHLLFAGVMLVPVGELSVLPEIEENGVKLGSVQIGKADPFRRALVGVAPVLLGLFCITAVFLYIGQNILGLYLIFEIGNTMFYSKKDLEGMVIFAATILTLLIIIVLFFYFLNPSLLQSFWSYLSTLNLNFAVKFFKSADLYLVVPLTLDLLVILLTSPFRL